jgi:pyruvyl transferase EpsO
MGAREALDSLGIGIAYSSDHRSYDPSEIARLPTDIPILVNGGGNFGDVWEGQHGVRLDVFERFTDRRIVQLPQSLFYRDPSLAKRESEIFRRHPDHTLMWRDDLSRSRAEALMGDAGILVPDTAFAARLPFAPFRGDGVQWILRSDQESILGTQPASGPGQTVTDWQTDPMPPALGVEMLRATLHAAEAHHSDAAEIDDLRRAIAALRIRRGAAIVRRGSATVTDRLHGLILSVLCGIPVVALDNESGKVHGVATRSLGSLPFVEQANDPMTAALIAERFASTVSDAGMGPKTAATR